MYTGHLYRGKGVETLVEAAKRLNINVYCVGGYDKDINRVKQKVGHPDNVTFTGFVDPAEIPVYQTAADILIAPYTEDSRPWVSPLKLFEYMGAGRPIVASNREVLQEILTDGKNAV
jgi:glycosyltransferase involved in cell wall biosynthesis